MRDTVGPKETAVDREGELARANRPVLRADVEEAEGDGFSRLPIHDRLLGQGCLPFSIGRALMGCDDRSGNQV